MKKATKKKKPGRKPLAKVRAVKRRAQTKAKLDAAVTTLGDNPFHFSVTQKRATVSLIRAMKKFQSDYVKVIEKYKTSLGSEPLTRHAVISLLTTELANAVGN